MRRLYAVLAHVLSLAVVAEFFFAAGGAFGDGALYRAHHTFGYVISSLAVLLAAVAGVSRMPGRLIRLPLLVVGLVTAQVVIARVARSLEDAGALVFGLHAVNGLAIAVVTGLVVRARVAGRVVGGSPAGTGAAGTR
ncbi:DUF6220 domain-containing protein [Saccharothrix sp. NPDC042600]|uniref:DUF6220 domain-containing protein n=1 Tax=Saccharothrix TaxID=2071 RepID=UPI0033D1D640|nr:hypothetical protein GCM10017745_43550 [Saccharothrix mutabilis subsp. capreolus]